MKYLFYLKSHTEAPDIEKEIEAKNIVEAVKFLCKRVSPCYNDFPSEELFKGMSCEGKKPFEDRLIDELLSEIKYQREAKWRMEKEKIERSKLKQLLKEIVDEL